MDTTTALARFRDAALVPSDDEDWTDQKWLDCASEQLRERYTLVMPNLRSGYWLHRATTTTVIGRAEYRIPPRAIAQALEKVEIAEGTTWRKLIPRSDAQTDDLDTSNGDPYWFSILADYVVLYPTPSAAVNLRFSYYLRPSRLAAVTTVGVVSSLQDAVTIRVTGTFDTYIGGTSGTCDVVNTTGCNEVAIVAMPFTNVVNAGGGFHDVTVPVGTDLSRVAAGQVLRIVDTTDYVPLPVELHESLVARVAASYLLEHGDQEQAGALANKAENAITRFCDTAQPRVRAQPFRVKSRGSYLRRRYG